MRGEVCRRRDKLYSCPPPSISIEGHLYPHSMKLNRDKQTAETLRSFSNFGTRTIETRRRLFLQSILKYGDNYGPFVSSNTDADDWHARCGLKGSRLRVYIRDANGRK